jgi:hypothetical protein
MGKEGQLTVLRNQVSKLLLILVLLLGNVTAAYADSYDFTRLDGPGALQTIVNGINDQGQIVGWYVYPDFTGQGFIYDKGIFTSLNVPGAVVTLPLAINNSG